MIGEKCYGIVIFISNVDSEESSSAEIRLGHIQKKFLLTVHPSPCYPVHLPHVALPICPEITQLRAPRTGAPPLESSPFRFLILYIIFKQTLKSKKSIFQNSTRL